MTHAFELIGNDGKVYQNWYETAAEAYKAKWQYAHGGLASVSVMAIKDPNDKDCWKEAKRIQVGRQCNVVSVAIKKHGCWMDTDGQLRTY